MGFILDQANRSEQSTQSRAEWVNNSSTFSPSCFQMMEIQVFVDRRYCIADGEFHVFVLATNVPGTF